MQADSAFCSPGTEVHSEATGDTDVRIRTGIFCHETKTEETMPPLVLIHATHHHVPTAAQSPGTAVRRPVWGRQCWTSATPRWSYAEPPRSAWSAAGPRTSSPLVSCKDRGVLVRLQQIHPSPQCFYHLNNYHTIIRVYCISLFIILNDSILQQSQFQH